LIIFLDTIVFVVTEDNFAFFLSVLSVMNFWFFGHVY